jgi:hypothetical protein
VTDTSSYPGIGIETLQRFLRESIAEAADTLSHTEVAQKKKKRHRKLSSMFVSGLAERIKGHYASHSTIEVLAKGLKNTYGYKRSELLYDIAVFDTAVIASPSGKQLKYPTQLVWAIESELKKANGRATLDDFNKLVFAACPYKLFIGPTGGELEPWMVEDLTTVARCGSGTVFLGLVPHPEKWQEEPPDVRALQLYPSPDS